MAASQPSKLSKEITDLLYEIEVNYPELYRYLDEDFPNNSLVSNSVDEKDLERYLKGLKERLSHYKEVYLK